MKGLLIKDMRLMLQQKRFFVTLIILSIGMSVSMEPGFIVCYMTILSSIFSFSTISYDEYDNCYPFLMSLPITRKSYVLEKYAFGIILGISAWMISIILSLLTHLENGSNAVLSSMFPEVLLYIPIFMVFLCIVLPLQLKFGNEKSRIILFCIAGGISIFAFIGTKLVNTGDSNIPGFLSSLSTIDESTAFPVVFLATAVLLLASIFTGFHIMQKKEF